MTAFCGAQEQRVSPKLTMTLCTIAGIHPQSSQPQLIIVSHGSPVRTATATGGRKIEATT